MLGNEKGAITIWLAVATAGFVLALMQAGFLTQERSLSAQIKPDLKIELRRANQQAVELTSALLTSNKLDIATVAGRTKFTSLNGTASVFELDPATGVLTVKTCNAKALGKSDVTALFGANSAAGDSCDDSFVNASDMIVETQLTVEAVQVVLDREVRRPPLPKPPKLRFAIVRATTQGRVNNKANGQLVVETRARVNLPPDNDERPGTCRFSANRYYSELMEVGGSGVPSGLGWVSVLNAGSGIANGAATNTLTSLQSQAFGGTRNVLNLRSAGLYTPADDYYDYDPSTLQFKLYVNQVKVHAEVTNINDAACEIQFYAPRNNSFNGGCFAPGTQIEMLDGTTKAVEHLQVGDRVKSPGHQFGRAVAALARGLETEPLIEIRTSAKRTLKVTRAHPVFTARGIVLAAELQLGDTLTSTSGENESITQLSDIPGETWVYNFDLYGKEAATDHLLFADGLTVGDHVLQRKMAPKTLTRR
jgi:hypothetical protein